jgi:fluoroquinolone resistance protein
MANAEHENLLWSGVNCWNSWRKNYRQIPDLSEAVFERLDLTSANLSHVDLRGAEFRDCVLTSASFESADLQGAKFGGIKSAEQVNFLYAKLSRNKITGCKWRNSSFNNANLVGTSIEECKFYDCTFLYTELMKANWSDCLLCRCNFSDAKLSGDHFTGTFGLYGNTMRCCVLTNADFAGADLRGLVGHQFDHNNIQGTLVAPRAPDDWSVLRRTYTGTRLIFNLIFLAFFFAPVVATTVFWMEVSRLEAQLPVTLSAMNRLADKMETTSGEVGRDMAQALRRAVAAVPVLWKEVPVDQLLSFWLAAELRTDPGNVGRLLGASLEASLASSAPAQNARQLIQHLADELERRPEAEARGMADALRRATATAPALLPKRSSLLISVILGLDVPWAQAGIFGSIFGIIGAVAGILLIVYNVARGLLTFFVTQLRDDEQVSNHTPRRWSRLSVPIEPIKPGNLARQNARVWSGWKILRLLPDALWESYAWLMLPQRIVSGLKWLAYGVTAVHVCKVVTGTVVLPT